MTRVHTVARVHIVTHVLYVHTVGDKIKFRIPFRRTAVVRLKNGVGGGTVLRLVKNSRSVQPALPF